MNLTEKLIEHSKTIPKTFGTVQQKAAGIFAEKAVPSRKDEEWKYTNIRPLFEKPYSLHPPEPKVSAEAFAGQFPFLSNGTVISMVNGKVIDLDSIKLPAGFKAEMVENPEKNSLFSKHFAQLANDEKDSLTALNTSLISRCLFISVDENAVITSPVYIIHIASSDEPVMLQNRLLIHCGKNAKADITLLHCSDKPKSETFTNMVSEIVINENASLEVNLLEQENAVSNTITASYCRVEKDAKFRINTFTAGGSLTRNKLQITLAGEGSEAILNGLYLLAGKMHVDNHTSVIHAVPHGTSNQTYKGVISDEAQGVFNGRIVVEPHAQKTQAYQSNKNLLLSRNAAVYSKPQLEIYADDVKCTHGATTGQIDEDALFYLRARGINKQNALALLVQAFAGDVMEGMENASVREYLHHFISQNLATLPSSL
jgi:Fe-S cluster assembly protein SufD